MLFPTSLAQESDIDDVNERIGRLEDSTSRDFLRAEKRLDAVEDTTIKLLVRFKTLETRTKILESRQAGLRVVSNSNAGGIVTLDKTTEFTQLRTEVEALRKLVVEHLAK